MTAQGPTGGLRRAERNASPARAAHRAARAALVAVLLVAARLSCLPGAEAASDDYFYPFVNPYEATVLQLPRALEVPLPAEVPTRQFRLKVFPERRVPDVFWYEGGLVCSLAYQEGRAPLIFLLPGAGARYDSLKSLKLQKLLHQAGFHVLSL
ncbi:MAG: hypothetical protein ACE147_22385, partial [Candidatus Methylomirabilales bacterium]